MAMQKTFIYIVTGEAMRNHVGVICAEDKKQATQIMRAYTGLDKSTPIDVEKIGNASKGVKCEVLVMRTDD